MRLSSTHQVKKVTRRPWSLLQCLEPVSFRRPSLARRVGARILWSSRPSMALVVRGCQTPRQASLRYFQCKSVLDHRSSKLPMNGFFASALTHVPVTLLVVTVSRCALACSLVGNFWDCFFPSASSQRANRRCPTPYVDLRFAISCGPFLAEAAVF